MSSVSCSSVLRNSFSLSARACHIKSLLTVAAAEVLREGIDRHGPDFILYYALARRLRSLNRLDEAREAMRLALEEDPCAITCALDSTCFAPI